MAAADVEKVLQLKHQLKGSCEGHKLLKILEKLQELDITLNILSETGIGKVVNSFRKHDQAGKVAKSLVNRWKALVPNDASEQPSKEPSPSEQTNREVEERHGSHLLESTSSRKKPKSDQYLDIKSEIDCSKSKMYLNGEKKNTARKESSLYQSSRSHSRGKEKTVRIDHDKREGKKTGRDSSITNKERNMNLSKALKLTNWQREKCEDECKKDEINKTEEKLEVMEKEECIKTSSMSFEAYLSYDLEPSKRKKCFSGVKNPKRFKTVHKEHSHVHESCIKTSTAVTEDPQTRAHECSVMDLLNVPLPTHFSECDDISQYQYFRERKAEIKIKDVCEEVPVFIGQRLKNKMQVYSGSKMTYLPTMMTLYQQCIRALQNNIDSLYEIGGVPFEILEPVLERCTPEQLHRIEEYNPVYIGVTDHLWEKHCQKDFRNAQLEEYESWREMYLRMSEERERKLKQLTKSIVSAYSGKPKGRQVKMAFINSAAKPPRNVRIQQEIHGTAVAIPHTAEKPRENLYPPNSCVKIHESRGRSNFESPKSSNSSGQTQDPRKIKRVAPMMAKSLKAFKKQLSRR